MYRQYRQGGDTMAIGEKMGDVVQWAALLVSRGWMLVAVATRSKHAGRIGQEKKKQRYQYYWHR